MTNQSLEYSRAVQAILQKVLDTQLDQLDQAAQILADVVAGDGIIYTYGTGHSHMVAEDAAYRAGGLAPVDCILEASLTGHEKIVQAMSMEQVSGMAAVMIDYYGITSRDGMIIISNSGRNATIVEMAELAMQRGIPVIAITSLETAKMTRSRAPNGKKLYEAATVVIDNCTVKADAMINMEGLERPVGPASGLVGMTILQAIIVQTIQMLLERGIHPPVFRSGNLDGSDEFNRVYLERYKGRIKIW
jgi:uncharacterized phosphosugar-binding protein